MNDEEVKNDDAITLEYFKPKLKAHNRTVTYAIGFPEKNSFVTSSNENMIKIWDFTTFKVIRQVDFDRGVRMLIVQNESLGLFVLCGNGGFVHLLSILDVNVSKTYKKGTSDCIGLERIDDEHFIVGSKHIEEHTHLRLFNIHQSSPIRVMMDPSSFIFRIRISKTLPNCVFCIGGRNFKTRVWNYEKGILVEEISPHDRNAYFVDSYVQLNDFEFVLSGGWDGLLNIWSLQEHKMHCRLSVDLHNAYAIHVIDNNYFLVGNESGDIFFFQIPQKKFIRERSKLLFKKEKVHGNGIYAIEWFDNSKNVLVTASWSGMCGFLKVNGIVRNKSTEQNEIDEKERIEFIFEEIIRESDKDEETLFAQKKMNIKILQENSSFSSLEIPFSFL